MKTRKGAFVAGYILGDHHQGRSDSFSSALGCFLWQHCACVYFVDPVRSLQDILQRAITLYYLYTTSIVYAAILLIIIKYIRYYY